jgi:DNA-directed RNA polymerase subunit beta'
VSHIWFFKGVPSRLGLLLDLSLKELERVLYFEAYIVLDPGDTPYDFKDRLTEEQYQRLREHGHHFRAEMGAAAIKEILRNMDLDREALQLEAELRETNSKQKAKKLRKRLKLIRGLVKSGNRPEWMILEVIPVMPPELRPLVALDGGRFATSDLNDLYRRVINRNNRLKKLVDMKAPEVIIRNEKRMLQEAVDALIENGKHGRVVKGPGNRPLKSLSDMLKGKPGRFRQNLLGKRVDYSGRSVIVVGPELRLGQCGLPKKMALELFKPFIIRKLQEKGHATTIKSAKRMADRVDSEVWEVLEEVIQEHPVLLNRAPTLHRLGIQAFQPHLVEGEAIRIHPLICKAFNADFDGDQMAVHVPLSAEAQVEAKLLMASIRNILKPAHGQPIAVPELDMVLGCNYLTKEINATSPYRPVDGGQIILDDAHRRDDTPPRRFANTDDVIYALDAGMVSLHDWIDVRLRHGATTAIVRTTPGRVLFSRALPPEMLFDCTDVNGRKVRLPFVNREYKTREIRHLVSSCFQMLGNRRAVELLNGLKELGFRYATVSGLSLAIGDFVEPAEKQTLRAQAEREVAEIEKTYHEGRIGAGERYNSIIAIWGRLTADVQKSLFTTLGKNTLYQRNPESPAVKSTVAAYGIEGATAVDTTSETSATEDATQTAIESPSSALAHVAEPNYPVRPSEELYEAGFNPLFVMADSGARARNEAIRQIAGMRGMLAKPDGSIIETPIFTSLREGLSVLEYFISTHGARKGLADTAIKTAQSGYLTRKLVDVAQDVIITMEDCGTVSGLTRTAMEADEEGESLSDRILGRVALEDVVDPSTEGQASDDSGTAQPKVLVKAGEVFTSQYARLVDEAGVLQVRIRSPLTCEASHGVCQKCYGTDLSNHRLVDIGEAIGILAAQSIGEPGTQLTMRTFHTGGAVSGTTGGVSAVHARARVGNVVLRNVQPVKRPSGETVALRNGVLLAIDSEGRTREQHRVPAGAVLHVAEGDEVSRGMLLFVADPNHKPILTKVSGSVRFRDVVSGLTQEELVDEATGKRERIITDYRREDVQPCVEIVADDGTTVLDSYSLPTGARLAISEAVELEHDAVNDSIVGRLIAADIADANGNVIVPAETIVTPETVRAIVEEAATHIRIREFVHAGDTLARIPRGIAKSSDIVSGLPRVTELFEARKPKDHATISELTGTVAFPGMSRGMQIVRVISEDNDSVTKDYKIPLGKFINVQEGDHVEAGDPLTDGPLNPHDILAVKGKEEVQRYLVREIKGVYGAFGERINDKHIEVIIRQMMKKVRVTNSGDTEFLEGDEISLNAFRRENARVSSQKIIVPQQITLSEAPIHIGKKLSLPIRAKDGSLIVEKGSPLTEETIATLGEHGFGAHDSFTVDEERYGRPAEAEPILQGVTKASLSTESFISAASFQQTTNVLTGASVMGKRDSLRGVKENVIMGRLIPAGTGTSQHRRLRVSAQKRIAPVPPPTPAIAAESSNDD